MVTIAEGRGADGADPITPPPSLCHPCPRQRARKTPQLHQLSPAAPGPDISPPQVPGALPGRAQTAKPSPQPSGVPGTDCLGRSLSREVTWVNGTEPWREESHRAGHTLRPGPTRMTAAAAVTVTAAAGAQRRTRGRTPRRSRSRSPHGHAHASAYWPLEKGGASILRTNERTPENRQQSLRHCLTCRRLCDCAMRDLVMRTRELSR